MKVVFSGPSLYGTSVNFDGLVSRPPAMHGDLANAVLEGASAIGLIDGNFEARAAVWHKEILYALDQGVTVLGAASMGALRAAECAPFGMIPVGRIAHDYLSGAIDDDAAVAVTHGPPELGSPPLTEALVDAEATIARLVETGTIPGSIADLLSAQARRLHFKDRTVAALFAGLPDRDRLLEDYRRLRVSCKQADALVLVDRLHALPDRRESARPDWSFAVSGTWPAALETIRARAIPGEPG